MKFIPPESTGRTTFGTRFCDVHSCPNTTREGKPYCTDHVDHHPYVQDLLSQLDDNETALARARLKGIVDLDSQAVQELLLHLNLHGARTEERLVRELHVDAKALKAILAKLTKAGKVQLGLTTRGSTVVRLSNTAMPIEPAQHSDETTRTA